MRWDEIKELIVTIQDGSVHSFEVKTAEPDGSFEWPASQAILSGAPVPPDTTPGAVFAAAIAQRAGVTPQVVYK
jgi:hypothetical protein